MQAIFHVSAPGVGRFEFTVSYERPVVLGRGSQATVRIDDPGLSRRHCRVELTPRGLMIHDLGSSNGTFVNGQRITTQNLRPGDEVSIGQTVMRPYPANGAPPLQQQAAAPQPQGQYGGYGAPQMGQPNPAAMNPMMSGEMGGGMMGGRGMGQMGMGQMGMGQMGLSGEMSPAMAGGYMSGEISPASPGYGAPAYPQPGGYPGGMGQLGARPGSGGMQGMGGMGGMAPQPNPNFGAPSPFGGGRPASMPQPATLDPSMIQCSRCGTFFKGTRAQIHWRDRNGDPGLLVCETCKDRERMQNDQVHGYELIDVLGKGAMGIVYKARHQQSGQIVALKIVNLEGDPNGLKNFIREARTGASVQHPNSVRTLEMGESSGKFYLAMEFVQGRTLEEIVKDQGAIEQNTVMRMAYVLLDTLEAARKANVVHRDLKPANILVTGNWEPKITDFGLAKLITDAGKSGLTAPGDLRGTPMFMPPEQLENAATVDHRADLYSLGATLYNALTNSYPFKVKTLRDLCMALEHEEPTPVSEANPQVSTHFSAFIQKLMEKDPARRFQTASEAQIDLRRVREQILAGH